MKGEERRLFVEGYGKSGKVNVEKVIQLEKTKSLKKMYDKIDLEEAEDEEVMENYKDFDNIYFNTQSSKLTLITEYVIELNLIDLQVRTIVFNLIGE